MISINQNIYPIHNFLPEKAKKNKKVILLNLQCDINI